jgi:hypothetical protein
MQNPLQKSAALRFVLTIGILSFFADFTYESARSVKGAVIRNHCGGVKGSQLEARVW